MFIELIMLSNHLILCRSLLLPPIFSSIRVFSNELVLRIGWPKYWSFSFSISSSNEYSGLISFRIDWFDLIAVQETSLIAQWVKNSLAVQETQETWVCFLGQEGCPGGRDGKPLQYSCLENFMDRVAKSWTQLSTRHTSSRCFVRIIPQNFDVFVGGGELHVFLFCPLELHPIF